MKCKNCFKKMNRVKSSKVYECTYCDNIIFDSDKDGYEGISVSSTKKVRRSNTSGREKTKYGI